MPSPSIEIIAPGREVLVVVTGLMAAIMLRHVGVQTDNFGPGHWFELGQEHWRVLGLVMAMFIAITVCGWLVWGRPWWASILRLIFLSCMGACLGWIAAQWQIVQHPGSPVTSPISVTISGDILRVDGRADYRSRLWVRPVHGLESALTGREEALLRVTMQGYRADLQPGVRIMADVRLFPPSGPLLPGSRDYGLQARMQNVIASGYIRGDPMVIDRSAAEVGADWGVRMAQYRSRFAANMHTQMNGASGGIAAAILVGDRRFIPEAVYNSFRDSGLAHLLAISGLHMGLVCFGVITFTRILMALVPHVAMHVSAHKWASVLGIIFACGYVLLSGAAISAVRAFIMAILVICAVMLDRFAISLRNVALAAIIILLFNPVALFTAGFQLSFAATAILVIWFEGRARTTTKRISDLNQHAVMRIGVGIWRLIVMSILAAAATTPFAAHHFGVVTPWGVLANVVAIPLTGFWIMPAGLTLLVTHLLAPGWVGPPATIMQLGIDWLIAVSEITASLPGAGVRVPPPSSGVLIIGLLGALCLVLRDSRIHRYVGSALLVLGLLIWAIAPRPIGVLLFREARAGPEPVLILSSEAGSAVPYANAQWQEALSQFTGDAVALPLAQTLADRPTKRGAFILHIMPNGQKTGVVRYRRGLTAACKAELDIVVSFEAPLYPCGNGTPIITLPTVPPQNSLLFNDRQNGWRFVPTPPPV